MGREHVKSATVAIGFDRVAIEQAGEVPTFKVRSKRRIKRAELDQWIDAAARW